MLAGHIDRTSVPVRLSGLIATIAIAALVGALAVNFTPLRTGAQTGGQIYGCINNYTGALRVVYDLSLCTASERPVSWDQAGQGPTVETLRVQAFETVETADDIESAFVEVDCPAGHLVVGGGAGLTILIGPDRWFMDASSPRLPEDPGSDGLEGWTASFETVDGESADGEYGFFVEAICMSTT